MQVLVLRKKEAFESVISQNTASHQKISISEINSSVSETGGSGESTLNC